MFYCRKKLRRLLVVVMTASSVSVAAVHAGKLPLDIPAPRDPRAVTIRTVGVVVIDRAGGVYVAVGGWGRILLTHDAGKTWMQSKVPVSSDLVAVDFPSPKNGWAVGHDGVVLHSSDSGKHWERQLDGRQYGDIMVAYYEAQMRDGAAEKPDPNLARVLENAK